MTNEEFLLELAAKAVSQIQEDMSGLLLRAARSDANESGWMYDFWCDGLGRCGDGDEMCSDEAQLACIRRFLARDRSNASSPCGV